MNTSDGHHKKRSGKTQQTWAAWHVFLKRPLAFAVLVTFFPLILAFVAFIGDGHHQRQRSNVPEYFSGGRRLSQTEEILTYLTSGETDNSINGIDLLQNAVIVNGDQPAFEMRGRVKNGGKAGINRETVSFDEIGRLLLQFPNVEWIRVHGEQLRHIEAGVLNQLPRLRSVEVSDMDIKAPAIEVLSRVRSLQTLKMRALWCDIDLSLLRTLPNLRSVHVTSESMSSSTKGIPLVSRRHIAELAQLPHLKELIVESGTVLIDSYVGRETLSNEESRAVADFANSLAAATDLRTLYIGFQNNKAYRQALRELRLALPRVSVHPAWYDFELGSMFNISCFTCLFCIGFSGLHYVSSCSLPQTGLVPGVQSAHLRVFSQLVTAAISCQVVFLMTIAGAHLIPAIAVSLVVAALILVGFQSAYVELRVAKKRQTGVAVLIATVPWIAVLGVMGLTDRLEWFMVGEQLMLAACMIAASLIVLGYTWPRLRDVHRHWAENGVAPAASMQEFSQSFNGLRQKHQSVSQLGRIAAAWSNRLRSLRTAPGSAATFIQKIQLWWMGMWQVSVSQMFMRLTLLIPAICAPMLIAGYVREGTLLRPPPALTAPMMAWLLVIVVGVIGVNLYSRFPLFANEILRPVRRERWRDTALSATLLLSIVFGLWSCVIVFALRIALGDSPDVVWGVCSFFGAIAFSTVGAALMAWVVVVRRMLFTIVCTILMLAAVVPVTATLTEGRGPTGTVDASFPAPETWLCIIAAEAAMGLLIFACAWRRWVKVELAP